MSRRSCGPMSNVCIGLAAPLSCHGPAASPSNHHRRYIKTVLKRQVSWDAKDPQLPTTLPIINAKVRMERMTKYSYYQVSSYACATAISSIRNTRIAIDLRWRYAMSGTDPAYVPTRTCARSRTPCGHGAGRSGYHPSPFLCTVRY
eukprot:1557986-Rhodomonas_salina.1